MGRFGLDLSSVIALGFTRTINNVNNYQFNETEVSEIRSLLNNDLNIKGEKGYRGESGSKGSKGETSECLESRDLDIYNYTPSSSGNYNINSEDCKCKDSPYIIPFKNDENNRDSIILDNTNIFTIKEKAVYYIECSINCDYLDTYQDFDAFIMLYTIDEKGNLNPLEDTLYEQRLNSRNNKVNVNNTGVIKLITQRTLNIDQKICIGIWFNNLAFFIENEKVPSLYILSENSSLKFQVLTNNFNVGIQGKKGERGLTGERGLDGILSEPREMITFNCNILNDISINHESYNSIDNYYTFELSSIEENLRNHIFINEQDNRNLIVNEEGWYYIEISLYVEIIARTQDFQIHTILNKYDETSGEFITLNDTLSIQRVSYRGKRIYMVKLITNKRWNCNDKYNIGIWLEDLSFNLDDNIDTHPIINIIKDKSSILIQTLTNNFSVGIQGETGEQGEKGVRGIAGPPGLLQYAIFNSGDNSENLDITNNNNNIWYKNWENPIYKDGEFLQHDIQGEIIHDIVDGGLLHDNLLIKFCTISQAIVISNNLENCIGFSYYFQGDNILPYAFIKCYFKTHNNGIGNHDLSNTENWTSHVKIYKNISNYITIKTSGYYLINYTVLFDCIQGGFFDIFHGIYNYANGNPDIIDNTMKNAFSKRTDTAKIICSSSPMIYLEEGMNIAIGFTLGDVKVIDEDSLNNVQLISNSDSKLAITKMTVDFTEGDNNFKGQKGEPGTNGVEGQKGEPGTNGGEGQKGEHGTNGTNGINGTNGEKGEKGDSSGLNNQPGDKGQKGEPGNNGNDGTNGTNGTNGSDGEKGEKGDDCICNNNNTSTFSHVIANKSLVAHNFNAECKVEDVWTYFGVHDTQGNMIPGTFEHLHIEFIPNNTTIEFELNCYVSDLNNISTGDGYEAIFARLVDPSASDTDFSQHVLHQIDNFQEVYIQSNPNTYQFVTDRNLSGNFTSSITIKWQLHFPTSTHSTTYTIAPQIKCNNGGNCKIKFGNIFGFQFHPIIFKATTFANSYNTVLSGGPNGYSDILTVCNGELKNT